MERFDASIYQVIVHVNVNGRSHEWTKKENYERLLDLFNFTFAFDLICTSVHVIQRLNKQIKATGSFLSYCLSWLAGRSVLCLRCILAWAQSLSLIFFSNCGCWTCLGSRSSDKERPNFSLDRKQLSLMNHESWSKITTRDRFTPFITQESIFNSRDDTDL